MIPCLNTTDFADGSAVLDIRKCIQIKIELNSDDYLPVVIAVANGNHNREIIVVVVFHEETKIEREIVHVLMEERGFNDRPGDLVNTR